MNRRFTTSGGVKPAYSKGFKVSDCCHPDFISGFEIIQKTISIIGKMLKQVQHDIVFITNLFTTHYSQFTKKVFAFTLAETLIVMGIIGVVAALTLPNLNQSTGNKEKVAKVKKIYSNFEDAIGRAVAVYGPVDEWFMNDAQASQQIYRFGERITEFIKLSKNCKNTKGCYTSGSGVNNNVYEFILADGASAKFDNEGSSLKNGEDLWIYVDVDGLNKGQNKGGIDQFAFLYDYALNSFVDVVEKFDETEDTLTQCINDGSNYNEFYCGTWVIQHGNMDYLKVGSNKKCPNGNILSDLNPTCN